MLYGLLSHFFTEILFIVIKIGSYPRFLCWGISDGGGTIFFEKKMEKIYFFNKKLYTFMLHFYDSDKYFGEGGRNSTSEPPPSEYGLYEDYSIDTLK